MLKLALEKVEAGLDLSMDEMSAAVGLIMDGRCDEGQIERFLAALHRKGECVAEVAGAAAAMRQQMTPIRHNHPMLLDTCGTGGDGSRTFNISTAAALVTAAAGVPVAKHGNRGITSRSGSADVLGCLGVHIEAGAEVVEACLNELGVCFCFAPLLHGAMKHVSAVRKRLPHPTIFNILGPLVNPASAPLQLLGVGKAKLQTLLSEAIALLGTRRAVVVHGCDGLDEVTLGGSTDVVEVGVNESPNISSIKKFQWRPADFGLAAAGTQTMLVDGPKQSAEIIRAILDGDRGPARDIVLANAAAALWIAQRADSLPQCVKMAAEAIDSGAARDLLKKLGLKTQQQK
jgi:anthranilate phosphoribosyltransferase